jgi:hypothetical protein
MAESEPVPRGPRNIVIFSDGTGQRGGVFFDEERTNIYKLYRATRVGPDSSVDPRKQIPALARNPAARPQSVDTIEWCTIL